MAPKDNMDLAAGGVKFDAGKVRMDLVPPEFVFAVAAVLTYGAIKYEDWNWAKGMRKGRLVAAALRHLISYLSGEELDDESGLPHTWHAATCIAMLIGVTLRGVAEEDRQDAVAAYEEAKLIFGGMKNPKPTVVVDPAEGPDETRVVSVRGTPDGRVEVVKAWRLLEVGEVIAHGDQYLGTIGWRVTTIPGEKVRDCEYGFYRRRVA